jgi:hypothetical protein
VNREEEIANSCERSGAKTQQPPPTPKGREKAASASGSGVSAAPFPGAGLKVPSGPLAKRDAESVPDGKSAQKRLGQLATGKDLPMRWAASKAFGCFLQLI